MIILPYLRFTGEVLFECSHSYEPSLTLEAELSQDAQLALDNQSAGYDSSQINVAIGEVIACAFRLTLRCCCCRWRTTKSASSNSSSCTRGKRSRIVPVDTFSTKQIIDAFRQSHPTNFCPTECPYARSTATCAGIEYTSVNWSTAACYRTKSPMERSFIR